MKSRSSISGFSSWWTRCWRTRPSMRSRWEARSSGARYGSPTAGSRSIHDRWTAKNTSRTRRRRRSEDHRGSSWASASSRAATPSPRRSCSSSPRPSSRSRKPMGGQPNPAGCARSAGTLDRMTPDLPPDFFNRPLSEVDPEIAHVLAHELRRQQRTLQLIASENFVPQAVLDCQGSVLTNKYAEGYPGRRYYGGCEFVDIAEQLAIDRTKAVFGGDHVNVQPHAGAQANAAVYHALLAPGDTILGLELSHGGHLTHGMKLNLSGRLYDIVAYHVREEDSLVDMDEVRALAQEHRPKMIIAGWSAYPRFLDFAAFREIADEVGAFLFVDMAHFAGLVAAGLHPNPIEHADVVATTIHKTLGGARGGMIICREEHAKKINQAVFPGQQGGPLEHVIAGKAVALRIAQTEAFRERQQRTVQGARAVGEEVLQAGHGVNVLTEGTDVHLILVDLKSSELDGKQAEDRLHEIGITVNRNAVPFDPRPPMVSSGLRVGTPALATRGLQTDDFAEVGRIIAGALQPGFEERRDELAERAAAIADRHPLYVHLGRATAVA